MRTLSWRRKLAFGSGDTALSLLGTTIDVYFLFFLLTVAKVPPAYAAAAIFVAKTWDWVNDPLMGVLSDRTRADGAGAGPGCCSGRCRSGSRSC